MPDALTARPTDLLEGEVFAGCRVEAVAGRGGMGIVYRAVQLSLGRPVALKLIASEHAADPEFRDRFEREARLAAAIDHPNVIPVYAAGEEDGRLYLVVRFVRGTDLHHLIRSDGRARARARRGAGRAGRPRAGRRARRRARAPRRQARQRADQRAGRPRVPDRLRALAPGVLGHAADRPRATGSAPPPTSSPEHLRGRPHRRALRRLRARLRAARGAHRAAAVRRARPCRRRCSRICTTRRRARPSTACRARSTR